MRLGHMPYGLQNASGPVVEPVERDASRKIRWQFGYHRDDSLNSRCQDILRHNGYPNPNAPTGCEETYCSQQHLPPHYRMGQVRRCRPRPKTVRFASIAGTLTRCREPPLGARAQSRCAPARFAGARAESPYRGCLGATSRAQSCTSTRPACYC